MEQVGSMISTLPFAASPPNTTAEAGIELGACLGS